MNVLEELKRKIADIETQSLAMEGCRPTFTVSEIMDLIDSVELAQCLHNACTDTIYRQMAIDVAIKADIENNGGILSEKRARIIDERISALLSAEPKRGKWVDDGDPLTLICDQCGYRVARYNNTNFCPNCGNDKRGR